MNSALFRRWDFPGSAWASPCRGLRIRLLQSGLPGWLRPPGVCGHRPALQGPRLCAPRRAPGRQLPQRSEVEAVL